MQPYHLARCKSLVYQTRCRYEQSRGIFSSRRCIVIIGNVATVVEYANKVDRDRPGESRSSSFGNIWRNKNATKDNELKGDRDNMRGSGKRRENNRLSNLCDEPTVFCLCFMTSTEVSRWTERIGDEEKEATYEAITAKNRFLTTDHPTHPSWEEEIRRDQSPSLRDSRRDRSVLWVFLPFRTSFPRSFNSVVKLK